MKNHDLQELEKQTEAKHKRRQSKKSKRPKMKISGRGVFKLKELKAK